ncbi:hypothetical protein V500_11385 [Pseudogymnoascus sp. VKM F-4518 (FW-2643)]|nr:hypothetical protein V500_11385 [Pseudogymnoascus sp. VKM F-4518 (FW-2643)]
MSVQHLATRLRITPQIIESIVHALPRNDSTQKELNDLVEAIQNVQHRYLQGDDLDSATKNTEQGASDKTRAPAKNLQNYLGDSLDQIDALVLETIPDILGKRLLRKFYEDIIWMSAKYYGDPTDDAEFKRLVNKMESIKAKKARKREREIASKINMKDNTVGDVEAEVADEVFDKETGGDDVGGMLGTDSRKDGNGDKVDEEGAFHPHDHMSSQASDCGQISIMSDDHLAKPLEPQTITRPNSFSEINTQTFSIKSNSSYLQDQLVGRPASESPLQRKSVANRQSQSVGQTLQAELAPADSVGHHNAHQTGIKVEESPTPASLLKRIPQYLEFSHNNMASLKDHDHGLIHLVEVTCAEKRKRGELDTENREAKFPKIAEEGHISKVSGQTSSGHEPEESDQIEELGRNIDTLKRSPQLSLGERVQEQSTGQKQDFGCLPHRESGPFIPTIDLRNSLELSKFGEPNPSQERRCLEPLLNERLPTEQQNHPEEDEVFIGGPHPHLRSILDGDDTDSTGKSLSIPSVGQIKKRHRRRRKITLGERKEFMKKARRDRARTNSGTVSETTISTMTDSPSEPVESLPIKADNIAEIQILCSDGELRPRGDEDEEMLVFVGWERAAQIKPGNNGPFNPVQLYSKFLRSRIDDNIQGNRPMRTDQAAMLVYVIMGIGSPCAITQFGKIATAMREKLEVPMEFLPGHEHYGRAALKLTLGPDEGPFKPFAESVLALEFYRFLENQRAAHGEMLPLTERGFDFAKIWELEKSLPPRHSRGANLRALQQIGCRLSKLTSIYGDGILALIPSSGCFGDCLNVLTNMDEAAFRIFQQHMAQDQDRFLLKVSPLLEPYVQEGMWGTLTLPRLRLEVDGEFDELVVKDRSDQLALVCLPTWACIQLARE